MFAKEIMHGSYYQVRVGGNVPDVRLEKIWNGKTKFGKKLTRYVCTILETGEPLVVRTSRAFRQESDLSQAMAAMETFKENNKNGTID